MSDFKVSVLPISVHPHPNADKLEIAKVCGYQSIVRKDQFKTGDLVAYIPEDSLLPEVLMEEMGLTGRLAGKDKNRVKAVRLRGILSQGLCYPVQDGWKAGEDVTEALGVTKYEPPTPTHMGGQLWMAGGRRTVKYDIENWKRHPDILQEGEPVVFTEKLHGTFTGFGFMPPLLADPENGDVVIFSKGLGAKGYSFKLTPENDNNLYVRCYRQHEEQLLAMVEVLRKCYSDHPIFILGETFGAGVQDLSYGHNAKKDNLGFRVFDVYIGGDGNEYLGDFDLQDACDAYKVPRVPIIYRGPFSEARMLEYTTGNTTLSASHIREGIVMRPVRERTDPEIGRVQLKSVSEDYLTRKGGTEFN